MRIRHIRRKIPSENRTRPTPSVHLLPTPPAPHGLPAHRGASKVPAPYFIPFPPPFPSAGLSAGVLLNVILPTWAVTALLVVTLVYLSYKSVSKSRSLWRAETRYAKALERARTLPQTTGQAVTQGQEEESESDIDFDWRSMAPSNDDVFKPLTGPASRYFLDFAPHPRALPEAPGSQGHHGARRFSTRRRTLTRHYTFSFGGPTSFSLPNSLQRGLTASARAVPHFSEALLSRIAVSRSPDGPRVVRGAIEPPAPPESPPWAAVAASGGEEPGKANEGGEGSDRLPAPLVSQESDTDWGTGAVAPAPCGDGPREPLLGGGTGPAAAAAAASAGPVAGR